MVIARWCWYQILVQLLTSLSVMITREPASHSATQLTMLCLAIFLTELYFNQAIEGDVPYEALRAEPTVKFWKIWADLKTWLSRQSMASGAGFASAINHCLVCCANSAFDLSQKEHVEEMLRKIVSPLQMELEEAQRLDLP